MFQSILEGQVGSSTEIAYFVWLAEWESRIVVVVGGAPRRGSPRSTWTCQICTTHCTKMGSTRTLER